MERSTEQSSGERSAPVTVRGTLATVAAFVGVVVGVSYPAVAGWVVLGAAGTLAGQRLGTRLDRYGETTRRQGPATRSEGEPVRR